MQSDSLFDGFEAHIGDHVGGGELCRHKTRRRQVSSGSQRRPPRSAGRAEDKSSILVMTLTESRELGLSSSSASCTHVETCVHPGSLWIEQSLDENSKPVRDAYTRICMISLHVFLASLFVIAHVHDRIWCLD